jgi:Flp pilus assembly pilin Flp
MIKMAETILKARVQFRDLMRGEEGQDLVEYALLVSPIALTMFGNVSSSLADAPL